MHYITSNNWELQDIDNPKHTSKSLQAKQMRWKREELSCFLKLERDGSQMDYHIIIQNLSWSVSIIDQRTFLSNIGSASNYFL